MMGIGRKIAIAAILIIVAAFAWYMTDRKINRLSAERDRYKTNTESLLSDVELFKVRDSLSASRVQALELTVKEYERFRKEDAALIRDLKAKNRDLERVSSAQMETITELSIIPKDTVIIRDSVPIPALHLRTGDRWYDFDGMLAQGRFTGTMVSRDSILVAETVRYKRFLGFLWKTHRVLDREVDIVNRNPHTVITGSEFVILEK